MIYYNEARSHLSLGKDAPNHRPIQRFGRIISAPGTRWPPSPVLPDLANGRDNRLGNAMGAEDRAGPGRVKSGLSCFGPGTARFTRARRLFFVGMAGKIGPNDAARNATTR